MKKIKRLSSLNDTIPMFLSGTPMILEFVHIRQTLGIFTKKQHNELIRQEHVVFLSFSYLFLVECAIMWGLTERMSFTLIGNEMTASLFRGLNNHSKVCRVSRIGLTFRMCIKRKKYRFWKVNRAGNVNGYKNALKNET